MPEYDVTIIEQQTSERTGIRRVVADTPKAARAIAMEYPDDEFTAWGEWEDSASHTRYDEDQAPVLIGPRVEGVLQKFASATQAQPFTDILGLASTRWGDLEIGVSLFDNKRTLFLNGVPIDLSNTELREIQTAPGELGALINYLKLYTEYQDRDCLGHLLDSVDSPEWRQLAALLAGEHNK